MRSLGEIIEGVRNGEKPPYDELKYAICAMDSLSTFDSIGLKKLVEAEQEKKPPRLIWSAMFQYEESFNRWKRALLKSPKEYIGWNNDPENPEFLKRREQSKRIFNSVIKGKSTTKQSD